MKPTCMRLVLMGILWIIAGCSSNGPMDVVRRHIDDMNAQVAEQIRALRSRLIARLAEVQSEATAADPADVSKKAALKLKAERFEQTVRELERVDTNRLKLRIISYETDTSKDGYAIVSVILNGLTVRDTTDGMVELVEIPEPARLWRFYLVRWVDKGWTLRDIRIGDTNRNSESIADNRGS